MKSHSVERIPAVSRLWEVINKQEKKLPPIVVRDIKYVLEGAEKLDQEVKVKNNQIATITQQKNDLQQVVTTKTTELQSKNSLLSQKEQLLVQKEQLLSQKDQLLLQKEQVITTKTVEMQNQLKEEYISVLHQLNPKVFSANYEDWGGKYQGYKDLIVNGDYKTIKKHIPIHKQKLVQKIETEKLALATKEAEKLDKAKEEAVSILHQLHPHAYPANYEDWPTHIKARKLLDSGNLQAIEKNLVVYRELLKKELTRQKEEVQNKAQLVLQKELEKEVEVRNKSAEKNRVIEEQANSLLTKEEEIITKNQLLTQTSSKVKKVSRKLAAKDKLASDQAQEIERLKALLVQKDELLVQKELENQQEIQNKEQLLIQKDNEISGLNVQIQQLSHIDFGIQMTGNEVSTQVLEVDLAGLVEPQNVNELNH